MTTELDRLIFQMETSLGKTHSVSPFTGLFAKHGLTTVNNTAAPAEEKKAASAPAGKKEAAPKKEKAAKAPAAAKGGKKGAAAPAGDGLSEELQAYSQCDIRVGKIIECTRHPESEKLYIEKIDLGEPEGRIRTIVSGLQPFVTMEDMLADKIIVFANMKPRKLAGIMSEGMVLCGQNDTHTEVELMRPPNGTPIGERVTLEGSLFGDAGLSQDSQPILNPKRKIEPKLLDRLATNGAKEGMFNGVKLMTTAGAVVGKKVANGKIA